jgi:3-deoxy-D-manno-octulosonic-acid transferase
MLSKVSHFFVQNQNSSDLLNEIGFKNVTVNGDTRFDRVEYNASHTPQELKLSVILLMNKKVFIAGSTWPDDEKLIAKLASQLFLIGNSLLPRMKLNQKESMK